MITHDNMNQMTLKIESSSTIIIFKVLGVCLKEVFYIENYSSGQKKVSLLEKSIYRCPSYGCYAVRNRLIFWLEKWMPVCLFTIGFPTNPLLWWNFNRWLNWTFENVGPRLWNSLPLNIPTEKDIEKQRIIENITLYRRRKKKEEGFPIWMNIVTESAFVQWCHMTSRSSAIQEALLLSSLLISLE